MSQTPCYEANWQEDDWKSFVVTDPEAATGVGEKDEWLWVKVSEPGDHRF